MENVLEETMSQQDIRKTIAEIMGNSDTILGDHDIDSTVIKLQKFESLLDNFEKLDRRKDEKEGDGEKFKNIRDHGKNNYLSMLVEKMKDKIDHFEKELEVAHKIQDKMIPKKLPDVDGWDLEGFYKPSKQVGGDYYDCFFHHEGFIHCVMADVSGKGIPSSLVVASMQAYLHAQLVEDKPLSSILENLNNYLVDTLEYEKYVTFFIGKLCIDSGKINFINAGHNPPYIIKNNGERKSLMGGGPILGQFKDIPYTVENEVMEDGDVLAMYTDGATEIFNEEEEEFSEERLIEVIANSRDDVRLKEIVWSLIKEMKTFSGNVPFGDDITMLLVKKNGHQ